MSSDEENHFEYSQETGEYNSDNDEVSNVENSHQLDDISPQSGVTIDANDTQSLEHASTSDDHGGKIMTKELPHSGNTQSEEQRTKRQRERKRRRQQMDEEDGPSAASHDSMAQSGTVMSTTKKFRSGSKQPVDNLDASARSVPEKKPAFESGDDLKPQETTDTSLAPKTSTAESQEDGSGSKKPKEEGSTDQVDGGRTSRLELSSSTYKDGIASNYMYPMTHSPRGKAFIINNKTFLPASGMQNYPRNGTDVDAEDLCKLFNALGFSKTKVYHNQTSEGIMNIFDDYATMDHTKYDCIICAVLTHGKEGLIYSTDGQIKIKELTTKFRCKNLRGKPKLFFFQACQGGEYMDGVDQTDGPGHVQPVDEVDGQDAPGNNEITLPIEADFMYAYSTVPGYYSWRNSRGSWFVQAIVSVFQKNALTMDVLRMLTRVNDEVAKQRSNTNENMSHNKKQIPSIISQLRKELYFFPDKVMKDVHGNITDANVHKKDGKFCSII